VLAEQLQRISNSGISKPHSLKVVLVLFKAALNPAGSTWLQGRKIHMPIA